MKWWLMPLLIVVVAAAIGHSWHMDTLLWQVWTQPAKPASAADFALGAYRVEVEARPINGVTEGLSALTFNRDTQHLWAATRNGATLLELDLSGKLRRTVRLHGVSGVEGLTHVKGNRYVIVDERQQRLLLIDVPPLAKSIDVTNAPALIVGHGVNTNKGIDGLAWDQPRQRLLVVKKRAPLRVMAVEGFADVGPGGSTDIYTTELSPTDSTAYPLRDLSSVSTLGASGHILLLSDESRLVAEYSDQGKLVSMMGLWRGMSGLQNSIRQAQGLAVDNHRRLYLVSPPNLFYRFVPTR